MQRFRSIDASQGMFDIACVYGLSRRAGRKKASEPRVNTGARAKTQKKEKMNHRRNSAQHRQAQFHQFANQFPHPSWLPYTSVADPSLAMATNSLDTINLAAFNQAQAMSTFQQDPGEVVDIGPPSKPAGPNAASPSMGSTAASQSTPIDECTCATDISIFLSERPNITTTSIVPLSSLLTLGEEALKFLIEAVDCKRANHRTYSNCFGLLMLFDLTLRLHRRLCDAAGAELPAMSENDTLTPATHPFASDGQDGIFGSSSLMRSANPSMTTRRSLRLSTRDSISLSDAFGYNHFTAASTIDPALRSASLNSATMTGFEAPDVSGEDDKSSVFEVLRSASTQLEGLQRSLRRFQLNLAVLDAGPPLNVGDAVLIPADDPVPAFVSLIQRLDHKRSLLYRDIADLLRREPQGA
ncbi:hypothetical protein KEM54_000138 [Ascosphaera aggregata]|nr:hypothetical protein KEM54_000138 [Ascosphaera aggregata]